MTLKEIAHLAGVSQSAVSRVVNDNGYVAKEKKEKILKLLKQYDFDMPYASPAIFGKTVLILTDSISLSGAYVDYIEGINSVLVPRGYRSYIFQSGESPEAEIDQLRTADKAGFGGALMISAVESERLKQAIAHLNMPIVILNRYLRETELDTVVMDNYKVGYMAARRLMESGHRRILQLAGKNDSTASQGRVRGFIDALKDGGLPTEGAVVYGNHKYERGFAFGEEFARKHMDFTAVFVASDRMALGFAEGIYQNGLRCPDDVSIICTENTKYIENARISLTTIGTDNRLIGSTSAELLLERISNPSGRYKTVSYSPVIIERNSIRCLNDGESEAPSSE